MTKILVGIDIGGTKIRVARGDTQNLPVNCLDFPTPSDFASTKRLLTEAVSKVTDGQQPTAIGVAAPGPIDRQKGLFGPATNLKWPRLNLKQELTKLFHCPISLEGDAACGGICEGRMGVARTTSYFVYVSVSTGIGSSIILNGQPLPTPHTSEVGRTLIDWDPHSPQRGSFQHIASGSAIVRKYGKPARDIHSLHDWDMVAAEIARGLYNLIAITDPQLLVLGGGVSVHFKKFQKPLLRHLSQLQTFYPLPPIKAAQFVETAPVIGALCTAAEL